MRGDKQPDARNKLLANVEGEMTKRGGHKRSEQEVARRTNEK